MSAVKRVKLIKKLKKISAKAGKPIKQSEDEPVTEVIPAVRKIKEDMYLLVVEEGRAYRVKAVGRIFGLVGELQINGLGNRHIHELQLHEPAVIDQLKSAHASIEEVTGRLAADSEQLSAAIQSLYDPKHLFLLVESNCPPTIHECGEAWSANVQTVAETLTGRTSVLTVGIKNSGKSTLCRYLLNRCRSLGREVCLLDCDPGKGFHLPGTVNLTCYDSTGQTVESVCYWTGEYSPLNYTQLYLESIDRLVRLHREKYFGSALVVNTMGYLTGLGQIILYELFNIVQPTHTMLLSNEKKDGQLDAIVKQLSCGDYLDRLYLYQKEATQENTEFVRVLNTHASVKHHAPETKSKSFESILVANNIKELLLNRKRYELKSFDFAFQCRNGNIQRLEFDSRLTDMQLLAICYFQSEHGLLRLFSIGYGINDKVYIPRPPPTEQLLCLKSELVEFDKQFYNISEKELIQLEERFERRIPWLMPSYQALGTSGYRNLQSKSQRH